MSGIGHLIGIDPDETAPNPDLTPVQRVDFPLRPIAAKSLADDRCRVGQKSTASAHLHFEQQRLALVHCHAAGTADRLKPPLGREPALIERVPGLVQHPHQGPRKIVLVVAGRDPHIFGGAAAKRMGADVEPAMREVEADTFHQPHGEAALRFDREGAAQAGAEGSAAWRLRAPSIKSGKKPAISSNRRSISATEAPGSYWSSKAS